MPDWRWCCGCGVWERVCIGGRRVTQVGNYTTGAILLDRWEWLGAKWGYDLGSRFWRHMGMAYINQPHLWVLHLTFLFVVILHHSHSITIISWQWYDVEVTRRKPKPTLLSTQGIFYLPHNGRRGTGLWWCCKLFIHSREMDCSTAKCYGSGMIRTLVPSALINWDISPTYLIARKIYANVDLWKQL